MAFEFKEVFGNNSYQDKNCLIIIKSDLSIPPSSKTTAQSIFVALLIKIQQLCNGSVKIDNGEILAVDEWGEPLEYENSSLYPEFNILFKRNELVNKGGGNYFKTIYKLTLLTNGDSTPS